MRIARSDRAHAEAVYPLVADAIRTVFYPPNRGTVLCWRKRSAFWRASMAARCTTVEAM